MVERDEPETQATVAADSASFILITEHSLQAGVAEFANRPETKTKTGIRHVCAGKTTPWWTLYPACNVLRFPSAPRTLTAILKGKIQSLSN
ncbi:hypothetical protein TNCT_714221 [Trichonephila clavata]|uniref:Uncharacterized protein n=1 Tax=Trichonephila clavata TaxID=2740835 RepID=A0A8X6GWM3_TRICU|nr:hypothetical protein TNCT_714221 [Trichonephila clavata]